MEQAAGTPAAIAGLDSASFDAASAVAAVLPTLSRADLAATAAHLHSEVAALGCARRTLVAESHGALQGAAALLGPLADDLERGLSHLNDLEQRIMLLLERQ